MEEGVKKAYKVTGKGKIVLLSCGYPSFSLFKNYEDRGVQFKSAVRGL